MLAPLWKTVQSLRATSVLRISRDWFWLFPSYNLYKHQWAYNTSAESRKCWLFTGVQIYKNSQSFNAKETGYKHWSETLLYLFQLPYSNFANYNVRMLDRCPHKSITYFPRLNQDGLRFPETWASELSPFRLKLTQKGHRLIHTSFHLNSDNEMFTQYSTRSVTQCTARARIVDTFLFKSRKVFRATRLGELSFNTSSSFMRF